MRTSLTPRFAAAGAAVALAVAVEGGVAVLAGAEPPPLEPQPRASTAGAQATSAHFTRLRMADARTPLRRLDGLRDRDLALEDLARRPLRQLVDEPDPARVLVVGDVLLDVLAQL